METLQLPVQFSPSALVELKRLATETPSDKILRVGVKGGGCSGMSYILQYDEKQAGDVNFEIDGLPFVINPAHEMYLMGMTISYDDGLNSRGFTFQNPNASTTCGCGSSFAV